MEGKLLQGLVLGQNVLRVPAGAEGGEIRVFAPPPAAVLPAPHTASVLDQDAPHRLRRGAEEVAAAVPILYLLRAHQPQVSLMDHGSRLERLTRLFLCQPVRRELAQLVVNQRQELFSGGRIALLDGGQNAENVAHAGQFTALEATCIS